MANAQNKESTEIKFCNYDKFFENFMFYFKLFGFRSKKRETTFFSMTLITIRLQFEDKSMHPQFIMLYL